MQITFDPTNQADRDLARKIMSDCETGGGFPTLPNPSAPESDPGYVKSLVNSEPPAKTEKYSELPEIKTPPAGMPPGAPGMPANDVPTAPLAGAGTPGLPPGTPGLPPGAPGLDKPVDSAPATSPTWDENQEITKEAVQDLARDYLMSVPKETLSTLRGKIVQLIESNFGVKSTNDLQPDQVVGAYKIIFNFIQENQ